MEDKRTCRHKLSKKVLLVCAAFCFFLSLVMAAFGAVNYFRGMMGQYQAYMKGILQYALTEIDGDDLENCIFTGRKSEDYYRTQEIIDRIKGIYDIEYIYIVKPLNTNERDNMLDVMVGSTEYDWELYQDTLEVFGKLTGDVYSSRVAALYLEKMQGDDKEISYFIDKTSFGYDYTGLVPILNSTGEKVAVLAVDISINEIQRNLTRYVETAAAGMILLTGVFLAGMYQWLKNRILVPISKIQTAAEEFVEASRREDDPELLRFEDLQIRSDDEMQVLAESLAAMAEDIKSFMKDLVKETREKERISTELGLAAKIQADILPCIFPAFPEEPTFDIFATMNPAKEVGGDFYDFFMVDERHLAIVVADVSGKGVPAALFMVIGKTLIKDHTQPGRDLGEVFTKVNDLLCESNREGLFITAFEGVLDLVTGELCFVNAGHEIPFICRKNGVFGPYKVRPGFVLAGMEGMRYQCGFLQLEEGDKIFQYTDGVTEAANKEKKLYGMLRLEKILVQNSRAGAAELLAVIKEDIDAFVGDEEQFDDITMLCLEFREKMKEDRSE